jgi:undecaprenyl-diphosphatase
MTEFQSVFLGIIQGLTEFLPVSSSGHLIIIPKVFNWDLQSLSFDIALHFGTMFAILGYLFQDWVKLISSLINDVKKNRSINLKGMSRDTKLLIYIILSALPVGLIGISFSSIIEQYLRSPLIVILMLIIVSGVMYLADRRSNKMKVESIKLNSLSFKKVMLISLSQVLALIPGTSRSGITISTGLFLNLSREDSAKLSFLLSTPIILGAALIKIPELMSSESDLKVIVIGIITSATVGYFAIKYLIKYLKNNSLKPFILYRVILAFLLLVLYY